MLRWKVILSSLVSYHGIHAFVNPTSYGLIINQKHLSCTKSRRIGMVTSTPTSDDCKGEVVGANGRIGSFLLRSVDDYASVSKDQLPGSYSQVGSPILVAVPATQISSGEPS